MAAFGATHWLRGSPAAMPQMNVGKVPPLPANMSIPSEQNPCRSNTQMTCGHLNSTSLSSARYIDVDAKYGGFVMTSTGERGC